MRFPLDRQPGFEKWLHRGLFGFAAALLCLALYGPTAFAADGEESEGGPPTVEPVIVPEVEVPVTPPVSVPDINPAPSSAAPAPKPSESAPSSSAPAPTQTAPTHTVTSSGGGSRSTSTGVNNSVRGPSSGGSGSTAPSSSGASNGASSGGDGYSPQLSAPDPSGAAAAASTGPTRSLQRVADELAKSAGQPPAKGKKGRQDTVARLGKALGTALLGKAAAVSDPQPAQGPEWVPLPGKSKLPYMLLVLGVMAIAGLLIWTQFRGPRESRFRRARAERGAAGFTVAPGAYPLAKARPRRLRAADAEGEAKRAGPQRGGPRRKDTRRAPRRKAA